MSARILLTITLLIFSITTFAITPNLGYEASEHTAAGDNVKLSFTPQDPGQSGILLHLPNGLTATYGEIVAMGDFYGIIGKPISQGQTAAEQKARFTAVFNSFAQNPVAVTEAQQIIAVIHQEKTAVEEGIEKGEKPEDVFKRISNDNNKAWSCITGGDCSDHWWLKPGRYVLLAAQDFDHFGADALISYHQGHELAIEQAILAHKTGDRRQLEVAYAMNALANHFLSDRFAAGHIRTPRVALPNNVTPSLVGTLLVTFMHDEENTYGFQVHNLRGNQWHCYGDRYYFKPINDTNRALLLEAMQRSADQIFSAFQLGIAPTDDEVAKILPEPDETGASSQHDIAALFYWDPATHTLLRRSNTANPQDRHWTNQWWGWSTLVMLSSQKGLPIPAQADLITAGYGPEALQYGLITDPTLITTPLT